jgi:diguanylate cyclase (GGDEF)-like protein
METREIGKYHILAVDDEKINLDELERILSPEFNVVKAGSGEEALKMANANPPDLALLDARMPGMSGFETLVRLKESHSLRDVPVLMMTGAGDGDEERCIFLGAADYVSKPFKNAIVKSRARTHIKISRQAREIERLGLVDPLTDIPNGKRFDDRAELEWRRCVRERKPISFLMVDIDDFKTFNGTHGHPAGDAMLRDTAKILLGAARRPTDLAARLGGEEFGILLPNTNLPNAIRIAEKIRADIESLRIPGANGENTAATASVGIASIIPAEIDTMKTYMDKAMEHLYRAKADGKNRIYAGETPDS